MNRVDHHAELNYWRKNSSSGEQKEMKREVTKKVYTREDKREWNQKEDQYTRNHGWVNNTPIFNEIDSTLYSECRY